MSDKKKLAIAVNALREINRIQPRDFEFTTVRDISAKAFVEMGRIKTPVKKTTEVSVKPITTSRSLRNELTTSWPFPTPRR